MYTKSIKDNFSDTIHIESTLILEAENHNTFFTIAIPAYKRLNSLIESVNSILNQSDFSDFSILIVDDNPERGDLVEKYLCELNHPKITYYKNSENLGMSGNWNRLLTLSNSPYVVMLHDDDILYNDALLILSQVISKTKDAYPIYFSSYLFYDIKTMNNIPKRNSANYEIAELKLRDFMWGNVAGPPSGMCINRKTALEMGGFDTDFGPSLDYDFYIKLASNHTLCKIIKYPLLAYRIEDNVSTKTETLLDFAKYDFPIKKQIIKNDNFVKKIFWHSFMKVQLFRVLENMAQTFHNQDFDTRTELKKMGQLYNKYDSLIYKIIVWAYFKNKPY